MRINLRGTHIRVPQQLLNRADIVTTLQQVGGKRVAQGMAACRFIDARTSNRRFNGTLERLFPKVVPAYDACSWVYCRFRRRKQILLSQLFPSIRILAL